MCLSQVNDIDKVTDTRTVRSIIIAKHAQFLTDTDCGLSQVRNQILRNAIRKFAQQCSRMSTDRVEITQHDRIDRSTGSYRITDNLFIDLFCISVRRFRFLDRSLFRYRQFIRLTVYGTRWREYDSFHSMFRHQFEEVDQRNQVVAIIKQRLLYWLSNRFARCKVNDRLNSFIFGKDSIQTCEIQTIQFFKSRANTWYFLYIVNNVGIWVR